MTSTYFCYSLMKWGMLTEATRYQVPSSFLARVCRSMRVPCPPRGYWAKNRAGVKKKVPKPPPALSGDEITWERGGGGTHFPPEPPTIRARRKWSPSPRNFAEDGRHRLLAGIKDALLAGPRDEQWVRRITQPSLRKNGWEFTMLFEPNPPSQRWSSLRTRSRPLRRGSPTSGT